MPHRLSRTGRWWLGLLLLAGAWTSRAQIDPESRNLLELGYDQTLIGHGPMGVHAYFTITIIPLIRLSFTLTIPRPDSLCRRTA